jgi:NAD(P)-dependent dehydrogenase (short-subunit alcohol dehydrogenase family)
MLFVADGPTDNWKSIFDLNVLALSACTKEAIQSMRSRQVDDGHVVNINRYVARDQRNTQNRLKTFSFVYKSSL